MRILVGNNRMADPGGSETYAYALIAELQRQGHDVECITLQKGMVSSYVGCLGVPVYTTPIYDVYDLALLSHSSSIELARNVKAFKIQTCHGIYPNLEQPVKGMDAYVAISDEVYTHLKSKGYNSSIIHNGIDCERFASSRSINTRLQTVLSLCHDEKTNHYLQSICHLLNVRLIKKNKFDAPIWRVENLINEADLVVTLGRGAYEAMAMGRNVLLYDNRRYVGGEALGDGMVDKDNIFSFLENNCSGRYSAKPFPTKEMLLAFKKYRKKTGGDLRKFAVANLNIKDKVNQYLNLVR